MMKKYVLGIAGLIGSGKTTAGKIFQKLGADFIDADAVVDELYGKGEDGYRKILGFFGDEYFKNGELNRKKLARIVFSDPKKLRILHDLIHPLVTSRIQKLVDRGNGKFYVVEATYFDKKHLRALIDGLMWIECPKNVLYLRLKRTRKLERTMFENILRFQSKPGQVDFVVENDGTPAEFRKRIRAVWEKIGGS
jgi:dephospho-CoA kinase